MRKINFLFIVIIMATILSGCKEEKMNESFYIIEDQVQMPNQDEEKDDILIADKTVLKLYYPDNTKQFILSKMIEVEEINKETIIEHILELGYVGESTRLFELSGDEFTGEGKVVEAEFSSNLENEIQKVTKEEGQIIYACIVNTLLDAYDAAGVSIRIGNEVLPYPEADVELGMEEIELPEGYYSYFALAHEDQYEKSVIIEENTVSIIYSRFFCEEGYRIYYELENYESEYNEEEGLAFFEKKDSTTSFCIYLSEFSKIDTTEKLFNQKDLEALVNSESFEIEIGVEGYEATGIFKNGEKQIINYYIIEEEGQIFVIEAKMERETSLEDEEHIANMLDSFQILK